MEIQGLIIITLDVSTLGISIPGEMYRPGERTEAQLTKDDKTIKVVIDLAADLPTITITRIDGGKPRTLQLIKDKERGYMYICPRAIQINKLTTDKVSERYSNLYLVGEFVFTHQEILSELYASTFM